MDNLSLFVEILQDLLAEKRIRPVDVHHGSGIATGVIYSWLAKEYMPKLDSLVALADFFDCSVDYLIGKSTQFGFVKAPCPSTFDQRLRLLMLKSKTSRRKLSAKTNVSLCSIQRFLTGTGKPLLESLVRLADFFDCSVDYLVGRSDSV